MKSLHLGHTAPYTVQAPTTWPEKQHGQNRFPHNAIRLNICANLFHRNRLFTNVILEKRVFLEIFRCRTARKGSINCFYSPKQAFSDLHIQPSLAQLAFERAATKLIVLCQFDGDNRGKTERNRLFFSALSFPLEVHCSFRVGCEQGSRLDVALFFFCVSWRKVSSNQTYSGWKSFRRQCFRCLVPRVVVALPKRRVQESK